MHIIKNYRPNYSLHYITTLRVQLCKVHTCVDSCRGHVCINVGINAVTREMEEEKNKLLIDEKCSWRINNIKILCIVYFK